MKTPGKTPSVRRPTPYRAPAIQRVRIDTARTKTGYRDANTFCTIHIHDDAGVGQPCEL